MIETSYNLNSLGKTEVEVSESGLLSDITGVSFSRDVENNVFIVGIDCGSTQTRAVMVPEGFIENEPDINKWFEVGTVIPSVSKMCDADRVVRFKSHLLADRLDSSFSINGAQSQRLLRGSTAMELEVKQNELIAAEKKVDSETLRFNIADAIGYSLIEYSAKTGKPVPLNVEVRLCIALPPDDLKMSSAVAKIRSDMRVIRWAWGENEPITIRVADFTTCSEPEAQVKAFYVLHDVEVPEEAVMLEVGGRNGATAILVNGATIEQGDKAIEQSGSQLLDKIGDKYIEMYGGRMPAMRHLMYAVKTGKMKFGNEYRDITSIVKSCKDVIAEDLFYKLQSQVISRQTVVSMQTLDAVILGGRVFESGDYDYSISVKFGELLKKTSPGTQLVVLSENLIPKGLVLRYLTDMQDD